MPAGPSEPAGAAEGQQDAGGDQQRGEQHQREARRPDQQRHGAQVGRAEEAHDHRVRQQQGGHDRQHRHHAVRAVGLAREVDVERAVDAIAGVRERVAQPTVARLQVAEPASTSAPATQRKSGCRNAAKISPCRAARWRSVKA